MSKIIINLVIVIWLSLYWFQGNYKPFGGRQSGGGAPNRTESGRIAAGFRADPELRFPKHASKTDVEPVLVSEKSPLIINFYTFNFRLFILPKSIGFYYY